MLHRLLDKAIGSHVQNGASAAEMGLAGAAGPLPPQYVDFKELTRSQMLGIKAKMGELRKLHGQVGRATFVRNASGGGAGSDLLLCIAMFLGHWHSDVDSGASCMT